MTASTWGHMGHGRHQLTFEDLKGLRAEGYIRDSTLDQRDGFGPDIQHRNIQRFAESYELILGDRWYTEFVTGRSTAKRSAFSQFLEDARWDAYDVLLVDHTSRFGRNQEECIRYKGELAGLGKVVVFVSQGIISGTDRDFLSERINETLDEAYSRNLSRYVAQGTAEKAAQGLANGVAPLGYRSEMLRNGRRERKVPDWEGLEGNSKVGGVEALLALLRGYQSGRHSYESLAEELNVQGYRNREGRPFTRGSVEHVLFNRFYEGKVVYHPKLPDMEVREGVHEVPDEVRELWLKCQDVKQERAKTAAGHPRGPARTYPFSRILTCGRCGSPYHGEAVLKPTGEVLRLFHVRQGEGKACSVRPLSQTVAAVSEQFSRRVLACLELDASWKTRLVGALGRDQGKTEDAARVQRIQRALENLRKQHQWEDISDAQYRREREPLERELKALARSQVPVQLPNLERAARLLEDLPGLWSHPGVTDEQREELIRETFVSILIDGRELMAVEPKPHYAPLFATLISAPKVGYSRLAPARPDHVYFQPAGINQKLCSLT